MRVYVESLLPCSADAAWAEVQKSALLVEVARPLVVLRPLRGERFPDAWTAQQTIRCRSFLFGILPLGIRTVCFEQVDGSRREIHTREHDPLIRKWDHVIRVKPASAGQCHYSDEIEVEAGLLTGLAALFVGCFYRHRQRRWQRVARRLTASLSAATICNTSS